MLDQVQGPLLPLNPPVSGLCWEVPAPLLNPFCFPAQTGALNLPYCSISSLSFSFSIAFSTQPLKCWPSYNDEGLVNMEDNENAEFKIFHCMQLLHHAYNHSFCQGYNHMHIHNQACIKNIIHFNISTTSSIQVEDLITKRKCNTYITPKLVARSKCFRLLLIH